jgi:predicted RNase H-like HicB family nuclease
MTKGSEGKVTMHHFFVVIEKANGNYSAYSPDLPGCVATGKTREEAERNMHDAIQMHVEGLIAEGLPIPEPAPNKERLLQALDEIHGIWRDDDRVIEALKELEEGWEKWRRQLDEV